ncbi:MAG TPA: SMP-30/gluconolactonase/LRE family protein [Tepidisphaeraceae bacterium]|nr:SMP-30/gluconolactonase/LRE family protein [Tepidisphaeraceae bacterium]
MASGETFVVVDKAEFEKIIPPQAEVETLAGDFGFIEGPVWFNTDNGGYLLFSDQPANTIFKWSQGEGISEWRKPSQRSNGNTKDLEGRLVTCEQTLRRVTVTEKDGTVRELANNFEGKKLNSPNDVVVKSDGTIWFTDPPYGVPRGEKREIDTQNVFRYDPKTDTTTAVLTHMDMPNGLAFSPDEKILYVAESLWNGPKDTQAFDVNPDGTVNANGRSVAALDRSRKDGVPDGIRIDRDGRIWSSAGDGVQIFTPDGRPIGTILTPHTVTNLTFGGPDGKTLYMTATKALCRIQTNMTGATDR